MAISMRISNKVAGLGLISVGVYGYWLYTDTVIRYKKAKINVVNKMRGFALKIVSGVALSLAAYIYVGRKWNGAITKTK